MKLPMLLDGAVGTMLGQWTRPGQCEQLCVDYPEGVSALHMLYAVAGSEAVTTNTFCAQPSTLGRIGHQERMAQINHTAVRLARESHRKVIASIGPGIDAKEEDYREQAAALLAEKPDMLVLESFHGWEEAREAVAGVKSAMPDGERVPIWLTYFSGDDARWPEGVDAGGFNCVSIDQLPELISLAPVELPLVVQPNAGSASEPGKHTLTPELYAEGMMRLAGLFPQICAMGGCCGTTPLHIRALKERIERQMR